MLYHIQQTEDGLISYPLHAHKHYEVMLYLEGNGVLQTETGGIEFGPQTILVIPPNVKHGSSSKSGFKNISIEGEIEHFLCFDKIARGMDNAAMEGTRLVRLIYENRNSKGAYLDALCEAFLYFVLQQLRVDSSMGACVRRIVEAISQNALDAHIDLRSILSGCGYSEDYARACFKKITGKTPHEFLTDIRIRHACFLIDIYCHSLSLSEIAERCGYVDYIYFSKKFKSVTGMSPREYSQK